MNGTTPQLSVVIPCLNEAARLPLQFTERASADAAVAH